MYFLTNRTQKFKCDLGEQWIRAQQYPLTNFPRIPQFQVTDFHTSANITVNVQRNVTLRGVRATNVAVEKKQVLHILSVCL
jgi:hypothetical protein